MSDQPLVQYASRTDVGMRRAANQDSLAVRLCAEFVEWQQCGHLFAVADGMGGHSVGDLASRITVDTLPLAYFKMDAESVPERLKGAIVAANRAINDKARETLNLLTWAQHAQPWRCRHLGRLWDTWATAASIASATAKFSS